MTAFLKNLIGRSRGTLEVAQPRIPSIYEPYRRGDGLLGMAPGVAGSSAEPGHDPGVGRSLYNRQNPVFGITSPTHREFDGLDSSNESEPQPSPMAHLMDSGESAWPSLTPHRIERPSALNLDTTSDAAGIPVRRAADTPGADGSPALTANRSESDLSSTVKEAGSVSPARAAAKSWAGSGATPGANPLFSSELGRAVQPPNDPRHSISSAGLDGTLSATPRVSFGQPESGQNVVQSTPTPVMPALLARQASSFRAAVRPPMAPRAGVVNPATPPTPALPSVEVSIGKVEVRAVFPEQAVRPAPARRARPTVSLDDYLNQRHRGKR